MITDFVAADPRKNRPLARITEENLNKRFFSIASKIHLENKEILDLGCANAAFGYLSMVSKCKLYHGVEIQEHYYRTASSLLKKYCADLDYELFKNDITTFLNINNKYYDVIFACGVIYGVYNVISFIENIFKISKEYVVFESLNLKFDNTKPIFEVINMNMVNADDFNFPIYGKSIMPNYLALAELGKIYGFECERLFLNDETNYIKEYATDTSHRFIAIFKRNNNCRKTLEQSMLDKLHLNTE